MTTLSSRAVCCAVCGAVTEFGTICSTNEFGSPDLDLRPPEMRRSTMSYWVQVCPGCGYAASDVSQRTGVDVDFLQSEYYQSCDSIKFRNRLAVSFYRQYLILLADNMPEAAAYAALHAAWVCDDDGDTENAVSCRKKVLTQLDKVIRKKLRTKGDAETFVLLRADILRRAGCFDTLLSEYAQIRLSEKFLNELLAFELDRARAGDTACYRVADATN